MLYEPLFQPDILSTIGRNFTNFFFFKGWFLFAAIVLILVLIATWLTVRKSAPAYENAFPKENFSFDRQNKMHRLSLYLLLLVLASYLLAMLLLENSLFNNHDLMSQNTIMIFLRGAMPQFDTERFTPTAFFDVNLVYALTHNYYLIDFYLLLKNALIAFLFYRFLSFVPVVQRLLGISALMLLPGIFWINNIIFPEQNMLLFILLSLIEAKKYCLEGSKKRNFFAFVIFMNLALYTKEHAILLYLGILIVAILYHVYVENINFKSFIHPFRTIKSMPLEFMMFFSMWLYSTLYMLIMVQSDKNSYIAMGREEFINLFYLYRVELFIAVIGIIVLVKKIWQKRFNGNPMFNEGLFLGALISIYAIIFYIKLAPISTHVYFKSYYLVIATLFGGLYLVWNMRPSKMAACVLVAFLSWSASINYHNFQTEQGVYYREAAEFLASNASDKQAIHVYLSRFVEYNQWTIDSWSTAFHYYWPEKLVVFKTPNMPDNRALYYYAMRKIYKPIIPRPVPDKGDYYIYKKNYYEFDDYAVIARRQKVKVYENKVFLIYKILD